MLFSLLALLASQVVSGFASDRDVAKRRQKRISFQQRWPALAGLWNRLRFH
jgi:hypothetical protein